MKKNLCLIAFAIFIIAVIFSACVGAVGPTDPDNPNDTTPHFKSVTVKYVRVLPIPNPEAPDNVGVVWTYGSYQGGSSDMSQITENTFQVGGIGIQTETVITLYATDPKEFNGSTVHVCRYLYIDGQELVMGSTYGSVKFKYGNDGKVKVVS